MTIFFKTFSLNQRERGCGGIYLSLRYTAGESQKIISKWAPKWLDTCLGFPVKIIFFIVFKAHLRIK